MDVALRVGERELHRLGLEVHAVERRAAGVVERRRGCRAPAAPRRPGRWAGSRTRRRRGSAGAAARPSRREARARSSSVSGETAQIASRDGAAVEARRRLPRRSGAASPRARGTARADRRAAPGRNWRRASSNCREAAGAPAQRPAITGVTANPRSAMSIASASTASRPRRPWRSASAAQPATAPGAVMLSGPRSGIALPMASGSAAAGARPLALRPVSSPSRQTSAKQSPPMPVDIGSTTQSTAAAASAASTALPPRSSARSPACVASGWLVATIPRAATALARAGNGRAVRSTSPRRGPRSPRGAACRPTS